MEQNLETYRALIGSEAMDQLCHLAAAIKNAKIVHINSTREGGGVAEILSRMIPLMKNLGLNVEWHVIQGDADFFQCTKMFHNLLQGSHQVPPSPDLLRIYEETSKQNADRLRDVLQDADIVFIHDPQPLSLISHFPTRKGKWIWRCHIDLSSPANSILSYLKKTIELYDVCVFSMKDFAPNLSHPRYFIPPSIDPLSEKNIDLDPEEIQNTYAQFHINYNRPNLLQVSRFDRFKDPLGVIEAYRLAKRNYPKLQLILAGGGAIDDPEEAAVLKEIHASAKGDPDIHVLVLPSDAHRTINALQRGASIVLQKSLKEGFGLTVSEALWKSKPVIGGNTGGILLQVINGETGLLATTPQEAADRVHDFFQSPQLALECGIRGKALVQKKFLITRQLRDYLEVMKDLLRWEVA
ncbi:MAG TPA: glycosyltransferase [Chlamydiales bacterium]|nr:glycosyltransferase [Chlamydiales bacterium]